MAKHYHSLVFLFLFFYATYAQTTAIPDANFEQALIDLGIDTDGLNGSVATADISGVTTLNLNYKTIGSLAGIEDFTSLTHLECHYNSIVNLDISQNTALTYLGVASNLLTNIDVSQNTALAYLGLNNNLLTSINVNQNTALTYLGVASNLLTNIDVSQNTALDTFICGFNELTALDVSKNLALTNLSCSNNQLTSLDVSQNTALNIFSCSNNKITQVDISQNTALTIITCYSNLLTSLDLSKNLALTDLLCYSNQITSLDLSQNTALTAIDCKSNNLDIINVENGNNAIITYFNSLYNGGNTCIQVDNATAANAYEAPYNSGWYFDFNQPGSTWPFSDDCTTLTIDDQLLEKGLHLYPNPFTNILTIDSQVPLKKVEIYSVFGPKIIEIYSGFKNIATDNLSTGMYVFKIYSDNGTAIKKLIKN